MENYSLIGLPNLGNTCFASAALQGIMSNNALVSELIISDSKYSDIFLNMNKNKTQSCASIILSYKALNSSYKIGNTEDASEFLEALLDDFKTEEQQIHIETNILYLDTNKTSKVKCYENILHLEITNSIMESTVNYLIEKTEDKIFRKEIIKMGNLMILSIKRFKYIIDNENIIHEKINSDIDVPDEINMRDKNCDIPMELTAFIVHYGDIIDGHYVCFRKYKDKWFVLDDEKILEITIPDKKKAYILFYQRV